MHVAADNYFIPAVMGITPPKETGITREYDSAVAFDPVNSFGSLIDSAGTPALASGK